MKYEPIPFSRVGHKVVYDTRDLDHYLNQNKNIEGAPNDNSPSRRIGTKEAADYLCISVRQLERIRFNTDMEGSNEQAET